MRPSGHRLTFQLGVATLARLLINTSRRFAYPFASALSRGLGVPPSPKSYPWRGRR